MLHFSDAPGETLVGGSWPCRLFEVEPCGEMIGPEDHKYGCTVVKVVRELPAWQALGPNGEEVAALIERCRTLTNDEAKRLAAARHVALDAAWYGAWHGAWAAAWHAARDAAWDAAWDAARDAALDAPKDAARHAAYHAALALIVKDLITSEQFEILYGPWASAMES